MGPEKDKCIGIFWVCEEIDTVNYTREKKDTIVEKSQVNRESKCIGDTEGYANKRCVEKYTRADIE